MNSTTLDSTTLRFNNFVFNNPWIHQPWIHQPLYSTILGLKDFKQYSGPKEDMGVFYLNKIIEQIRYIIFKNLKTAINTT